MPNASAGQNKKPLSFEKRFFIILYGFSEAYGNLAPAFVSSGFGNKVAVRAFVSAEREKRFYVLARNSKVG